MAFSQSNRNGVVYMTSDILGADHAFTTRHGGVSTGVYASLNLGVNRGDLNENVEKNYDILCSALGFPRDRLVFSHQVHECTVRVATPEDAHVLFTDVPYDADGLITNEKNLPLIIFTADCIPILLHDPAKGVIGAVHAGWRGTVGGIAAEAVRKMEETYGSDPKDIRAAIGAGICFSCFETGAEVPEAAREAVGSEAGNYISVKKGAPGKFTVDLKGLNSLILRKAGVPDENIDISPECTMCSHEKYWSHRYTRGIRGVQASVIMLRGE